MLSCATSLKLDQIKLWQRLGVPPPRVKIITSQADRASPTTNQVTKGKVMFDEMTKSASTTPMTDCTTSGEKGQLWEAPACLPLVIQTSAICCFDQQNEICPSGYINQPKSATQPQIGHPSAGQKIGHPTSQKTTFHWLYKLVIYTKMIILTRKSKWCQAHLCAIKTQQVIAIYVIFSQLIYQQPNQPSDMPKSAAQHAHLKV